MGFYSGLAAEKYDRQYSNSTLIKKIYQYAKPFKPQLIIITIVVILRAFTEALPAWVISKMLDRVELSSNKLAFIFMLSGIILILEVGSYFLNLIRRRNLARVISELVRHLSTDAFAASTKQDLSFHDLFSSGKIVSRISSDTREFGTLINLTTDVLSQLLQSLIIAIILLTTEWRMALIVLTLIPLVVIFMILYRKVARKVTREGMRAMAEVNSAIKETISGITVAKNFRQEKSIFDIFNKANQVSYKVNIRRGLILSIVFPTMRTLGGIMSGILVYFGALSVVEGIVTAGAWYMFLLSLDRFLMPIFNIASYWTQVQSGLSAAERIFALIDAEHSVKQVGNHIASNIQGKIDFNHLVFGYNGSAYLLNDFNLHIRPGESIAIVGHTGAGKTSISRLITRFYEFQEGELLVDDRDIRAYDIESLRKNMGIVSQVPFLFDGSVAENIRYANESISSEEMLSLARSIGGGEWLDTLPEGFDMQVGERGSQLSMGQRQLVALMRVLVQKPAIFILDEATASVDPFTEKQIQIALNLILKKSTSILIAHRLSTVRSADRIIVLRSGKIIEEGNHENLIVKDGYYAELYNTFFRHQSLQYIENVHKLLNIERLPGANLSEP
jgi:ATP-binding cassette subfamily B protein